MNNKCTNSVLQFLMDVTKSANVNTNDDHETFSLVYDDTNKSHRTQIILK